MTVQDVPIRCDCEKRVLLAIGRPNEDGQWYIHVRVHKSSRLMAEVVVDEGSMRVRCRSCLRWHKITIRHKNVAHNVERLPNRISLPPIQLRSTG